MEYLIALIAALVGGLIYQTSKRNTAEGQNINLDVNKKVNDEGKDIAKNNGLLEAEEEKRKDEANAKDSTQDLVDFFNKPK